MSENLLPASHSTPSPEPPQTASEGIRPQVTSPVTSKSAKSDAMQPTSPLQDWVIYRVVQGVAVVLLGVVLYFVLLNWDFRPYNAAILSAILAVVGSFFLWPLLPIQAPPNPPPANPHVPVETPEGLIGELRQLAGWWMGLLLVVACGWGASALVFTFIPRSSFPFALGIQLVLSLGVFLLLERNFWLSRFMSLRVPAGLSWRVSALLLWLFGIVALLLRSTTGRSQTKETTSKVRMDPQPADGFREVVETVVFVVVLVLMLKTFVAEAFVIPTGSMAETLYGYQKLVTCPQCGLEFPVNCSSEVESDHAPRARVTGCTCPNCRLQIQLYRQFLRDGKLHVVTKEDMKNPEVEEAKNFLKGGNIADPGPNSGDRVLVSKYAYDLTERLPTRLDVVVFKYPGDNSFPNSGPFKGATPLNYIKRLVGLPGETIAIHRGKLFVLDAAVSPKYNDLEKLQEKAKEADNKLAELRAAKANEEEIKIAATEAAEAKGAPALLWQTRYQHQGESKDLFKAKDTEFKIHRKPPAQILSMKRLVYDNDHPAKDITDPEKQRWQPRQDSHWSGVADNSFQHDGGGAGVGWLRYQHLLRGEDKLSLITDFMGYNTQEPHPGIRPEKNWASDLIVECRVKIESPKDDSTVVLQLSRGEFRYEARFNVTKGECELYRVSVMEEKKLGEAKTQVRGAGTYDLRFANVDDRLAVWVDGHLMFGNGVEYESPKYGELIPVAKNDLEPVSVGAYGAKVTISKLKLFRDTYYTTGVHNGPGGGDVDGWSPTDPTTFEKWARAPIMTYYVQPDHFLCMGDNSPESSDGRSWGLVPRRLMLGKAVTVYYPFDRARLIK